MRPVLARLALVLLPPALIGAGAYLGLGIPAALVVVGGYFWIELRQVWSKQP